MFLMSLDEDIFPIFSPESLFQTHLLLSGRQDGALLLDKCIKIYLITI